jgi:hypothetical protein
MTDATADTETWRPIDGFDLYEVSDAGRIRSQPRRRTRGGILKPCPAPNGYLQVTLTQDGIRRTTSVHVIVAAAFHGPRPDGLQVRHLNGDQADCRAVNLAYGTPSQNNLDKRQHGTDHYVNKVECLHGHSFLDPANVIVRKNGRRACRTCTKRWAKETRTRRKLGLTPSTAA